LKIFETSLGIGVAGWGNGLFKLFEKHFATIRDLVMNMIELAQA